MFVGHSITLGVRGRPKVTKGYFIKLKPETSYKRMLLRDTKKINNNMNAIKKLIKYEDARVIDEILFHDPFGLRGDYPGFYEMYLKKYKNFYDDYVNQKKYKFKTLKDILHELK